MAYKSVLILSDNRVIASAIIDILDEQPELVAERSFKFACHKSGPLSGSRIGEYSFVPIDLKTEARAIVDQFDLVISAHCKQIFPRILVDRVKCINIHPGLNPHNRGWFPQVFSIMNGLPLGATIHEIDHQLDHGPVIDQIAVELASADNSLTAYNKVQEAEIVLIKRSLAGILNGSYATSAPQGEGNLNLKCDFEALRHIDLNEVVTFRQAIDRLRALTHPPFSNAYFTDPESGRRIFLKLSLDPA